jgi:hypothetical protein
MVGRIRHAVKAYGKTAVGIYASLWAVPFGCAYVVFAANGNFGQDPVEWLEWALGPERLTSLLPSVGLTRETATFSPNTVSLIFAYLTAEIIETPRMAATLLLAPRVKKLLDERKEGKEKRGVKL